METLSIILLHWNSCGFENGWHWPSPFFFFFMILFIFILIGCWRRRRYSCRWPGWFGYRDFDGSDAKEILKKRYANGDIDKEEYERILREISNTE